MIYSLLYIRKKFYIIRQTIFIVLKKPTNIKSVGFIYINNNRLSLAELWCTTCSFETVFLTLFHTWVTSQESCFLKHWPVVCVCLKKRS